MRYNSDVVFYDAHCSVDTSGLNEFRIAPFGYCKVP